MRKTRLYLMMFMLLTCCVQSVFGNDGVYFVRGGQLIPLHETDISVKKEVLSISLCDDGYARVDVAYEFDNHGSPKSILMGFEAESPYNTDDKLNPKGIHPYIEDFTVELNGRRLSYKNAVVEPGSLDIPFTGPKDDTPEDRGRYSYAYTFEASMQSGINHVHHTYRYRMSYGVGRTFEVPYWLTPASRWQGGRIGDFTLRISAPKTAKHFVMADSLFTGNEFRVTSGVGKVRHTHSGWMSLVEIALRDGTVEWHSKDFLPKDDIDIQSADSFTSFNEDYPLGYFYDRSDQYVIWPIEKKLPVELSRNLPYASRGYVFKKKSLQQLFSRFWWYMPDASWKPSTEDFTPREWRLINEGR